MLRMDMSRKVAVITGAASGIGYALSKVLAENGFHLVMSDINEKALSKAAYSIKKIYETDILTNVCDVSSYDEVHLLAQHSYNYFGHIDLLFNNAGVSGPLKPLWQIETSDLASVFEVNLFGVMHGVRAFIPLLSKQCHRSRIINIGSIYSLCSGSLMGCYAMSKHALLALTESLYFDLKRQNYPIDVSIVLPSFVSTALLDTKDTESCSSFHVLMQDLMSRSRPPMDIAKHIIQEITRNQFYILPDREIKEYSQARLTSIVNQDLPHCHPLEKTVGALLKRQPV